MFSMNMKIKNKQPGFTIVELIIVIVVIGILAVLVIVAYGGIVSYSQQTSAKHDLAQVVKALEVYKVGSANEDYPSGLALINISNNATTTYEYSVDNGVIPKTYCVTVTVGSSNFYASSASTVATSGACPGHVGVSASSGSTLALNGGVVTTVVTSGVTLTDLRGVVVDNSGNIFVTSQSQRKILKVDTGGVVTVFAGSGTNATTDGTGTAASFNTPGGLAIDSSGNMYLAECNGYRIRKISPAGVVTTLAGSSNYGAIDGTGSAARFWCPQGVAVDNSGNVYVADGNNNRIRKVTPAGVVTTLAGSGVAGYADGTGTSAQFSGPVGIAVDSSSGNVYVADDLSSRIRKITPAGVVTTLVGGGVAGYSDGTGAAAMVNTSRGGMTVDSDGKIYLADGNNNRIRVITQAGVVTTLAGSGVSGSVDGVGISARFGYPRNLFVTPTGVVYVSDNSTSKIRKIQ